MKHNGGAGLDHDNYHYVLLLTNTAAHYRRNFNPQRSGIFYSSIEISENKYFYPKGNQIQETNLLHKVFHQFCLGWSWFSYIIFWHMDA